MKKTAIEVLEEHMKEANGDLTVWQEEWIITAMEEYAEQQVNSVDLADVVGCSFCGENAIDGEREYIHKKGYGCCANVEEKEDIERLDTGHTVTIGYPLE